MNQSSQQTHRASGVPPFQNIAVGFIPGLGILARPAFLARVADIVHNLRGHRFPTWTDRDFAPLKEPR